MPDICMCNTATPTEGRQSYFTIAPFDVLSGECDQYRPNAPLDVPESEEP